MKRTAILLVLLVTALLLSCRRSGPGAPSGPRSYTIATIVKLDGIAWFNRMRDGVRKFGDETGHKCFLLGPAQADAALQVQIIEDVIAQGVDAICVVPFSVEAIEPVLRKARSQGIVVVSHEASNQVNADAGYVMNKIAVTLLEGKKLANGADLGVPGYTQLRQDAEKPNLFYGSAWVDVTKQNMDAYNF